jgi:hypothetical protein
MTDVPVAVLSKDQLGEQWFAFRHEVFGQLKDASRRSKFNEKEIAARIGRFPSFVNRCLRGKENMTMRTMHDLARGMNCRLKVQIEDLDGLTPANRPRRDTPAPEHERRALVDLSGPQPGTGGRGTLQFMGSPSA